MIFDKIIFSGIHWTQYRATRIEVRLGVTNRDKYEQLQYGTGLHRISEDDFTLIRLASSARITNLVKIVLLPRISQIVIGKSLKIQVKFPFYGSMNSLNIIQGRCKSSKDFLEFLF